jgi:hypothetical protein
MEETHLSPIFLRSTHKELKLILNVSLHLLEFYI